MFQVQIDKLSNMYTLAKRDGTSTLRVYVEDSSYAAPGPMPNKGLTSTAKAILIALGFALLLVMLLTAQAYATYADKMEFFYMSRANRREMKRHNENAYAHRVI